MDIQTKVHPVIVWDEFLQRRQVRMLTHAELRILIDNSPAFKQEAYEKLIHHIHNKESAATSEIITAPMMQNLPVCNRAEWRGKEKG